MPTFGEPGYRDRGPERRAIIAKLMAKGCTRVQAEKRVWARMR